MGPLLKVAAPLVTKAWSILGLSAASSTMDAGIQKKIYGSRTTTLIISNNELNDIMKIVQALEDHDISLEGVTKTIKNETKQQRGGFLGMLMGTLGASLLGDILSKGLLKGRDLVRAGEGVVRVGEGIKKKSLMPPRPLTNFEIQDYYMDESRFNGVYSRNNLPNKIKNGAYVINLDEYADTSTHWIALYVKNNEIIASIVLV